MCAMQAATTPRIRHSEPVTLKVRAFDRYLWAMSAFDHITRSIQCRYVVMYMHCKVELETYGQHDVSAFQPFQFLTGRPVRRYEWSSPGRVRISNTMVAAAISIPLLLAGVYIASSAKGTSASMGRPNGLLQPPVGFLQPSQCTQVFRKYVLYYTSLLQIQYHISNHEASHTTKQQFLQLHR